MYKKFGIEKTVQSLDGVFAFVLSDLNTGKVFAARDPIGVRSMFIGKVSDGSTVIASEIKQMYDIVDTCEQFRPGHWMEIGDGEYHRWYNYVYPIVGTDEAEVLK